MSAERHGANPDAGSAGVATSSTSRQPAKGWRNFRRKPRGAPEGAGMGVGARASPGRAIPGDRLTRCGCLWLVTLLDDNELLNFQRLARFHVPAEPRISKRQ
jgi:hypothetical protein